MVKTIYLSNYTGSTSRPAVSYNTTTDVVTYFTKESAQR